MELRFWRKKETREDTLTLEDLLLQAGIKQDNITRDMALNIPTLSGCVELISNTVASLPIKLYQELDGKVNEIKDDIRLKLLNNDTGDTLDAFQFKKAMVQDYLLMGNGYAYIKREKGAFESLHYVKQESASININADPIFKQYDILVNGENYKPYEFIKLLRNSRDGATGTGIVESNNKLLAVAYNSLDYENILAKTGGNKKGFIKALSKLTDEAIAQLKEQWNKMYSKNSENCVVLNNGLEFQESSSTPTELQMNENKVSNGNEICKILNVPPSMITGDGKANESDYEKFVKMAILPILNSFISALNRDFLLDKEKKSFYFAFDIKELLKGDILKRFQAYEIALKNGFLGVNEVRYEEDKPEIEAFNDVIKLGLSDVLYNTKTGDIYTPNTDKSSNMKGGENIEN
ncbi:phage portal protein [Clostridium neonatale]|uniref:phage portal protein n=1 Tax=Clostridium neonatale TaxID=137838 RepID=UPI00291B379D|nr:Phage portal protein [Clostridium neonatale]